MAKYIPSRNYIGSSEIATDLDVTGPATFANSITLNSSGNDTYIEKTDVGDLYILNSGDDKDIILGSDDGSGNTTTYFALDGSESYVKFYKDAVFVDNEKVKFGTGLDLEIYHDGSNSYINQRNTGDLIIQASSDDKDIIFKSDDGSGGVTEYLRFDGGDVKTYVSKDMKFNDSVYATFGNNDLLIGHDSTNSRIYNYTGNLQITNLTDDANIVFQCDDGSGGLATYLTLDGSTTKTIFSKPIEVGVDDAGHDVKFFGDTSGKHMQWDASANQLQVEGSIRLNSSGGNALFKCDTGNLKIQVNEADHDLLLQCDDGSGSIATYFKLDGQTVKMNAAKNIEFQDNVKAEFGEGDDLEIYHDGTDSFINNDTGDLYIKNSTNDKDIIFQSDDGSGGVTEYFKLDGSVTRTVFQKDLKLTDDVNLRIGTANNTLIDCNGTNTIIKQQSGDLQIENTSDDSDIIFKCDDGSGGTTEYFKVDGSSERTVFSKEARFSDNVILSVGSGQDLKLLHDGTNTVVDNFTGHLYFRNFADDQDIIFQSDDGSGGVETFFFLDGSHGGNPITMFPDNSALNFGSTLGDLKISHDGSNSTINNGTGALVLRQSVDDGDLLLQCDDGSGGTTAYITLDGSETRTNAHKEIRFDDDVAMRAGAGGDLRIKHDGTDSLVDNFTGNLYVRQNATDKDIFFMADDGSGSATTYFFLDGSATKSKFLKPIEVGSDGAGHDVKFFLNASGRYIMIDEDDNSLVFTDNANAKFGNSGSLQLVHDGTDARIDNMVGHLKIRNYSDNSDIIFETDNGSGSTTTYLTLDGGFSTPQVRVPDNVTFSVGDSLDLRLEHDGSNSRITQDGTGNLIIRQKVDDADLILQCDDGSGGTTAYLTLDGSAGHTTVQKEMQFENNVPIRLGTSNASQMSHSGSDFYFANAIGDVDFYNHQDDGDISFFTDNGSGGSTEYLRLDGGDLSVNILTQKLVIANLPTSDPGVSGQVWNNNGVLNISAGG